ncbi:hypothetical protein BC830DRAFT_1137692 [Chytriomyces sp. MP71]|nr:hypothetical protein BC830DRAFT_1137692 [Chytriomyces sp. MP71]
MVAPSACVRSPEEALPGERVLARGGGAAVSTRGEGALPGPGATTEGPTAQRWRQWLHTLTLAARRSLFFLLRLLRSLLSSLPLLSTRAPSRPSSSKPQSAIQQPSRSVRIIKDTQSHALRINTGYSKSDQNMLTSNSSASLPLSPIRRSATCSNLLFPLQPLAKPQPDRFLPFNCFSDTQQQLPATPTPAFASSDTLVDVHINDTLPYEASPTPSSDDVQGTSYNKHSARPNLLSLHTTLLLPKHEPIQHPLPPTTPKTRASAGIFSFTTSSHFSSVERIDSGDDDDPADQKTKEPAFSYENTPRMDSLPEDDACKGRATWTAPLDMDAGWHIQPSGLD